MNRETLALNPILHRELEARAAADEGYRLFNYTGPGHYLLLLQLPLIYGLLSATLGLSRMSEAWTAPLFLVTVWLQIMYFTHAAARFCAGSIVIERERGTFDALRLLPRSSRDIFFGKYLAAIAPLICEALFAIPFLGLYAWFGAIPLRVVLLAAILEIALIVFFGMWGMFWSLYSRDVLSAVSRAFCTALAFNVLPLVLGIVMSLSRGTQDRPEPTLWASSPLALGFILVRDNLVGYHRLLRDLPMLGLVAAGGAALMLALYWLTLRRLSTR